MMDLTVTLVPINLRGVEEPKQTERFKLTAVSADAEFCLNVKCRSPFAKFKVLISVTNFNNDYLQVTVCSRYDSVCVINAHGQKEINFDGFAKHDDEGATVPFVVGPLFSAVSAGRRVRDAVHAIERHETVAKVFINEAYLKGVWSALKRLIYNDNDEDKYESDLVNNVVKFINVDKTDISARSANVSKWVPAINYVTGKQLLTVLFIFKFN
ncbi:hypothetical protein AGNV_151 [Anticarsia gemmatalis multiple nucleopolyhedrovirus]|uniref:Ac17 n=1 Tax=Anticarsia gemmatalis multiple nucleopolyhedrovirus TaxID=268591 RepID=A0A0S3J091_9ABAC|nr:hypothetical protein AGNV_151 [Anticarsia gemmatalis multiple nucleopolyhedrovirus]ALR71683.1 hypothetical protein AGNV_151 [Anticarsia gemmatalis multiple nucleopolyhedrovirus]AXE72173.1 hypothetical protein [Anticarsia gemmatalis multiple nucleopolyhedrovirus]